MESRKLRVQEICALYLQNEEQNLAETVDADRKVQFRLMNRARTTPY